MKRLSFLLLFACGASFAQGLSHTNVALYNSGGNARVVPSAVVTVCAAADPQVPCTTKVSIFTNYQLTSALVNPFNADANGNYAFYAGAGNYTVTVTGIGITGLSYQITLGVGTPTSLAGPGTITGTFGGNHTTTGNNTHSGTETLSGGGSFGGTFTSGPSQTISTITASGLTATVTTTVTPCSVQAGDAVFVSGASVASYNSNTINSLGGLNPPMWIAQTACGVGNTFTYQTTISGLGAATGGTVTNTFRVSGTTTFTGGSQSNQHVIIATGDFTNHNSFNYSAVSVGGTLVGGGFDFPSAITISQGSNPMVIGHAVGMDFPATGTNFYGSAVGSFINCRAGVACAGTYTQAICFASSSKCWGDNPQVQDFPNGALTNISLNGMEADIVRTNAVGQYTAVTGMFAVLGSGSAAGTLGTGATIKSNNPAALWSLGYRTDPGCCAVGWEVGKLTGGFGGTTVSASQPITFINNNGAGDQTSKINTDSSGHFLFNYIGANQMFLGNVLRLTSGYILGFVPAADPTVALDAAICRGSSANLNVTSSESCTVSGGLAAVVLRSGAAGTNGALQLNGSTSGTAIITAPAIAATTSNPITSTNALAPSVAGAVDVGTAALPWGNLWLGTAATNNFKFQPPATAAARTVTWTDPLANVNLPFTNNTSTTTTQVVHATATAGLYTTSAIATGDLPTAIPIGNVGSAGLSATAPIRIAATGVIDCAGAAQCVTSTAALTNNVMVKGAGLQATQTSLETDDGTTMTYTGTGGYSAPKLISTVATGTAPLTVSSTTAVANLKVQNLSAVSGGDLPSTAGGTDVGSTALPYGNLWLGTAATNNFKFQPATTSGARIITMADPLSPTTVAMPYVIANGTATFATTTIATGACSAVVTVTATGGLTTDSIETAYATVPAGTANADGLLVLSKWMTANNVNFERCNPTAGTLTPSAIVLNWRVVR